MWPISIAWPSTSGLKHGKAISRAEIIRGLIEAAFQSGTDLSQADSIDTIVELLTSTKKKSAR